MEIILLILCLIFGIFIILKSGDLLIESSLNISNCTGISEQFIGATLLSFATTAPELFVSCISAGRGSAEISVNNGLGSIICNIGLVLSISLIALTQKVNKQEFNFKGLTLLFVFFLLFVFCLNKSLSKLEGVILILIYLVFIIYSIKNISKKQNNIKVNKKQLIYLILMFLLGTIGVALSANVLVNCAQKLALKLHISESIIALTVLAIGTCLPELVSTLTAIKKKTLNLALGNIVGANIMNCTVLMGLSAILSQESLKISAQVRFITIPFCIFFNILLLMPILLKQKTFKIQGVLMLFTFFVYYFLVFYFQL